MSPAGPRWVAATPVADGDSPWPSWPTGHEPGIGPACVGPGTAGLGPRVSGAGLLEPAPSPAVSGALGALGSADSTVDTRLVATTGGFQQPGTRGNALTEARTCPGKGGRLPVHATWLWFSCREIWDMFWPVDEEDWMSFTPGTWTTEELRETKPLLSPGDPSPTTGVPGPSCSIPCAASVRPSVSPGQLVTGQKGPQPVTAALCLFGPSRARSLFPAAQTPPVCLLLPTEDSEGQLLRTKISPAQMAALCSG